MQIKEDFKKLFELKEQDLLTKITSASVVSFEQYKFLTGKYSFLKEIRDEVQKILKKYQI
jgi:hypothetical protein